MVEIDMTSDARKIHDEYVSKTKIYSSKEAADRINRFCRKLVNGS
jgi:hypothetical protein